MMRNLYPPPPAYHPRRSSDSLPSYNMFTTLQDGLLLDLEKGKTKSVTAPPRKKTQSRSCRDNYETPIVGGIVLVLSFFGLIIGGALASKEGQKRKIAGTGRVGPVCGAAANRAVTGIAIAFFSASLLMPCFFFVSTRNNKKVTKKYCGEVMCWVITLFVWGWGIFVIWGSRCPLPQS